MRNTIKQRLRRKTPIGVNEAHRARTVTLAMETLASCKPHARIGFFTFCLRQIGFCGWQTWAMQAALLFCLCLGLRLSHISVIWPFSYSAPFVLRVSAVLIALCALPTLYRSSKYRMLEVEIATRIGYARLLMSRLALVGVGDVLMLSSMLAFAVLYTDIGLINALFCLLLPFFTVLSAFVLLLPRIPIRALPFALFVISTVMLIAIASLGARLPDVERYPAGGAIGLMLVTLCVTQLCAFNRQGGFADVQFSS